jgi:hypothetical protein
MRTLRLRFHTTDDASSLQHVDEAPGPRVADPQAALEEGHRRGLRLDDDLDRLVQQRIVIRVEVAVRIVDAGVRREHLRHLEIRLVELLLALPRLLDDERDLLLGDIRALDALQAGGAERLEEHVALAEQRLRPPWSRMTRESVIDDTANAMREGTFALIMPVITSTDGRCVASTRWMPTARDFCASRITASSTACGAIIIRFASSSITTSRYGIVARRAGGTPGSPR